MKASEALYFLQTNTNNESQVVLVPEKPGVKRYLPMMGVFRSQLGMLDPLEYELLFGTPIFLEHGVDADCPFWKFLPKESLPSEPVSTIAFLCDFLDKLRVAHDWSWENLSELVKTIEDSVDGLT